MKKSPIYIILLFSCFFTQCRKIQYKPDKENPDLPSYTEKGIGIGGVLINDSAWLTSQPGFFGGRKPLEFYAYPNGDSIVMIFDGDYKNQNRSYRSFRIYIVLKKMKIEKIEDIVALHDYTYPLDGINNYGGFIYYSGDEKKGHATGQIQFGRVEIDKFSTYGDGSPNNPIKNPYYIAGRFDMNFTIDKNYALTKGRFDFTVLEQSSFYLIN